jgi:GAF domain-containing protein
MTAFKDASAKLRRSRERMDKAVAQNRPDVVTEATREVEEVGRKVERLQQQVRDISELLLTELDRLQAALEADIAADAATFADGVRAATAEMASLWPVAR